MTPTAFLRPEVDDLGAPFWEGLAEGELRVQRCTCCGRLRFPPRPMCARCRSVDATWKAAEPAGTIWSFAVVHPPVLPAFAASVPFNVVIVALQVDPSIRLVGNVVDAAGHLVPGDQLAIGAPVHLAITEVEPGTFLPYWRLRSTG